MRIVLDTNVFASALIAREGPPGRLLSAVKRGDCTLVTSVYQIEELRKVLGRDRLKPYIRSAEADDLLHGLESVGVVVAELPEMDLSLDPKDNPLTPGEILVKEYLEPMGISQNAMARAIGVAPRAINEIVHARRSIPPAMSIRFGAFFGQSDEFWHGIQVECDFHKFAGERKRLTDGIRPASMLSQTV